VDDGRDRCETASISDFELLQLPDGRRLEYCVSGPADGSALLFHHGTPGGCTQFTGLADGAHRLGLRLVTSSRAGYGQSTRHPGRRIADVTEDTERLLDSLGIGRCLVAGWSGGGPHALACGARLPDRVRGVLCIAGLAPSGAEGLEFLVGMGQANLDEFGCAAAGEDPLRTFLEAEQEGLRSVTADGVAEGLATLLPAADLRALADGMAEDLAAQIRQGVGASIDGWLDDDLAFLADWGFSLDEITVPVTLWQGSDDLMVPFSHGRWLAGHVPGAVVHLEEGEGHLSIGSDPQRMLDELLTLAA
jgi:pimeloyl-ACP methyl ester carboxylesterase